MKHQFLHLLASLSLLGPACDRRATTKPDAAAALVLYDDDEMRGLAARIERVALGMKKSDVLASVGRPTTDQEIASKEMRPDPTDPRPLHVFGSSVAYIGRDGRTLPRVAPSADRLMTGEPTIALRFDVDGLLVAISANIEGVAQRGGSLPRP